MSNKNDAAGSRGALVWSARPSVGPYIVTYGIVLMVILVILVTAEFILGSTSGAISSFLPASMTFGNVTVPYPAELATGIIIALMFAAETVRLVILRARSKYSLFEDGLSIDLGIVNLENIFLSPLAFSDARLIRTWTMRIVHRGVIIVDANDERHFYLRLIKDPIRVQSLIRSTLGRPRVRTD